MYSTSKGPEKKMQNIFHLQRELQIFYGHRQHAELEIAWLINFVFSWHIFIVRKKGKKIGPI